MKVNGKVFVRTSFAILVGVFFLGCYDTSTPTTTVGAAATALKENESEFLKLLIGQAKLVFSNPTALAELKTYVSGFEKLEVGTEKLISEVKVSDIEIHRKYELEVTSNRSHVLAVKLSCVNYYGIGGKVPTEGASEDVGNYSIYRNGQWWHYGHRPVNVHYPRPVWHNICRISSLTK